MNVSVDETADTDISTGIDIGRHRHFAGIDIQKRPIRAPVLDADPTGNAFVRFLICIIQQALIRHRFAAQQVRFSPRAQPTASWLIVTSQRASMSGRTQDILQRDVKR
jgi:hypothetical protein